MKLKLMLVALGLILAGCAVLGPRGRTAEVLAANEARQLALACFVWAGEHNGVLPANLDAVKDCTGLQKLDDFELCASGKLADIKQPAATVLVREKQVRPGGRRAVAYADGHAALTSTPQP